MTSPAGDEIDRHLKEFIARSDFTARVKRALEFVEAQMAASPPPPRDAAREAFEDYLMRSAWWTHKALKWHPTGDGGYMDADHDRLYRAFLAGRASVKP